MRSAIVAVSISISTRIDVAILACLLSGSLAGCGGQVSPSGDGGSAPPASTSSSGKETDPGDGGPPGFDFDVCPSDPPHVGTPCATPNHGCAYTDFGGVPCQAYLCDGTSHWANTSGGCG